MRIGRTNQLSMTFIDTVNLQLENLPKKWHRQTIFKYLEK